MSSWVRRWFGPRVVRSTSHQVRFLPRVMTLEERCTPSLGGDFPTNVSVDNTDAVKVATSANGSSVVVYTREVAPGNRDVFAQQVNGTGVNVGAEIPVYNTPDDEFDPDVAIDSLGNFVVVYTQNNLNSGDFDVNFGIFTFNLSSIFYAPASNSPGFDETNGCVAMSANGNWVVAFETSAMQGNDIYAKRFNLAGTQLGNTVAVSVTPLRQDQFPAIDCNGTGAFSISYVRSNPVNGVVTLNVRRYNAGGGLLGNFNVSSFVAGSSGGPNTFLHDIAIRNNGVTRVAYRPTQGPGALTISSRTITNVLGPVQFLFTSLGVVDAPALAINRVNGKFVLAATNFTNIVVREFSATGTVVLGQNTVSNANAITRRLPAIALNQGGKYFVSFLHAVSGTNNDVYGAIGQF